MEYIMVNGELYHHGIKGQKWGVRRFQNADGTVTNAGKKRYYGKADTQRDSTKKGLSDKQKKALKTAAKVGVVAAGVALAAYGGYRLNTAIGDKNYARNMAAAKKAVESINDKMVKSYMSSDPYKVALGGDEYVNYLSSSRRSAEKQLMSSVSRKKNFDANKFVEDYNPMNYDRYQKVYNLSQKTGSSAPSTTFRANKYVHPKKYHR